jgi:hypothetical protein
LNRTIFAKKTARMARAVGTRSVAKFALRGETYISPFERMSWSQNKANSSLAAL